MEINWEELLESPELCKLVYENLGVSKKEWDKMVKDEDFDEAIDALYNIVSDGKVCFKASWENEGYGNNFSVTEVCDLYFTCDENGEQAGPMTIECTFDNVFFFSNEEFQGTAFKIVSSLDDQTVFKIVGHCDCPLTVNNVKYTYDGRKYIKA